MLKMNDVEMLYRNKRGISNISFQINKGKVLAILGENGCGKTTTFKVILGVLKQQKGSVLLDNKILNETRERFGYVCEERSIIKDIKVIRQLKFIGELKKVDKLTLEERIDYWLKYFDIEKYQDIKIQELSKGNQQKVQIICALLDDPQVIIFDEPLNGLDIYNIELFKRLIEKLKKEKKIILISSHQYHNIENLCDNILYLKKGKIILKGEIQRIKTKRKERYIEFVDADIRYWEEELRKDIDMLNNILTVKANDYNEAKVIIKKLVKEEINNIKLRTISLKELIEETLNEDIN